jgi:FKBP-type peptidyl-prolyl cis-trans isomerase
MKLRTLAAVVAAFALAPTLAVAQNTAPAAPAAAPAAPDKMSLSYAIGYDMARDLAERKVDLDLNTVIRGIQEGYAKKEPTMDKQKLGYALGWLQNKMAEQSKAEYDRVLRENKAKSDAFLNANKGKPGIQMLANGVQYRAIETGSGARPTANSTVEVHLRGSVPSGQEFANTYQSGKPVKFVVNQFPLKGVQTALMQMPVGSRWELFLPPDQAYGNGPGSPLGPGQAVVFEVKLVSVN